MSGLRDSLMNSRYGIAQDLHMTEFAYMRVQPKLVR
jgi:hypothetical protein